MLLIGGWGRQLGTSGCTWAARLWICVGCDVWCVDVLLVCMPRYFKMCNSRLSNSDSIDFRIPAYTDKQTGRKSRVG